MTSLIDYTVNGFVTGNIYALLAVGLALIFGVANLINFAHGSVYTIGAYVGWAAITFLHTPFIVTLAIVGAACAALGALIERVALRPLQGKARIAPLLATIGLSFVLDQIVQLVCSPDPRALPADLPHWRISIGGGSIGPMDLLIATVGLFSAGLLYAFLRFTKLGNAMRATAQDRDAARQMGVNVDAVNSAVFAIASALGGVSGLLVGMYYNHIDPAMSFQATLKGVVAVVIGGVGNVPGAIVGSLMLGLTESYGIALFGTTYRNLFAFALLILFLVLRPNGLFGGRKTIEAEPLTGSFIAPSRAIRVPAPFVAALAVGAFALPLVTSAPYLLQILANAWLAGLLALSLTLVSGTAGQMSLGHAALLAIGGYASALLATDAGVSPLISVPFAGLATSVIGTALVFPGFPAARALHRDRDAGDRRDRRAGHSQLGEFYPRRARRDGNSCRSPLSAMRRRRRAPCTGSASRRSSSLRYCNRGSPLLTSAGRSGRYATTRSRRVRTESRFSATRRSPSPSRDLALASTALSPPISIPI